MLHSLLEAIDAIVEFANRSIGIEQTAGQLFDGLFQFFAEYFLEAAAEFLGVLGPCGQGGQQIAVDVGIHGFLQFAGRSTGPCRAGSGRSRRRRTVAGQQPLSMLAAFERFFPVGT